MAAPGAEPPLRLIGPGVDLHVGVLGLAELVPVQPLVDQLLLQRIGGLGVAGVVQRLAVRRPGHPGELDPAQLVAELLRAVHAHHPPHPPVRAAVRDRVGQPPSVRRRAPACQGDRAVRRQRHGVDEHPGLGVRAVLDVQDRLLLRAVVVGVERPPLALGGQAEALVVPQGAQPLLQPRALRDGAEVALRQLVLRRDPGEGLLAVRRLQPAVGIGHGDAVVGVGDLAPAGGGVGQARLRGGDLGGGGAGAGREEQREHRGQPPVGGSGSGAKP